MREALDDGALKVLCDQQEHGRATTLIIEALGPGILGTLVQDAGAGLAAGGEDPV